MKTMKPTETSEVLAKTVEKANTIARNLIMKKSRGTGVSKTTTIFQRLKRTQVSAQQRCADSIKELRKRNHSKLDADNRHSFCFDFGWTVWDHSSLVGLFFPHQRKPKLSQETAKDRYNMRKHEKTWENDVSLDVQVDSARKIAPNPNTSGFGFPLNPFQKTLERD